MLNGGRSGGPCCVPNYSEEGHFDPFGPKVVAVALPLDLFRILQIFFWVLNLPFVFECGAVKSENGSITGDCDERAWLVLAYSSIAYWMK